MQHGMMLCCILFCSILTYTALYYTMILLQNNRFRHILLHCILRVKLSIRNDSTCRDVVRHTIFGLILLCLSCGITCFDALDYATVCAFCHNVSMLYDS